MEEIIHINVELQRTDTHHVAITKTRLWPPMLGSLNWILKNPIPGKIADGIGLLLINNMAIVVEGFVTDILIEHFKRNDLNNSMEILNPDTAKWYKKKEVFNTVLDKKIETYGEFPAIEVLFLLRNNISHGRSHSEISKTNIETNEKSFIESENKNYQIVRNYLIEKRLFDKKDTWSNADILWKFHNAVILFAEAKSFLISLTKNIKGKYMEGISSELKYACQI